MRSACSGCSSSLAGGASRLASYELGDDQQIVGDDCGSHEEFKMFSTFDERALHTAPAKEYRDAPFDAGAESLSSLERAALFVRFPFGAALASGLRDAADDDASIAAGLKVVFAEEASVGGVHVRGHIKERFVIVE